MVEMLPDPFQPDFTPCKRGVNKLKAERVVPKKKQPDSRRN
jgi:hypothetical protein